MLPLLATGVGGGPDPSRKFSKEEATHFVRRVQLFTDKSLPGQTYHNVRHYLMGDYMTLTGEAKNAAYKSMFGVDAKGDAGNYDIINSMGVFYENELEDLRLYNSLAYEGVDFKNSRSDNFLSHRPEAMKMLREVYDSLVVRSLTPK